MLEVEISDPGNVPTLKEGNKLTTTKTTTIILIQWTQRNKETNKQQRSHPFFSVIPRGCGRGVPTVAPASREVVWLGTICSTVSDMM